MHVIDCFALLSIPVTKRWTRSRRQRVYNLMIDGGVVCLFRAFKKAEKEWLLNFDRADTIVLRSKGSVVCLITDSDSIGRMRSIYAESKWAPYRYNTLPNDLDKNAIDVCVGDSVLRRFSMFGGELWECTSYTENRTTKLNVDDRTWLESIFSDDQNAVQSK